MFGKKVMLGIAVFATCATTAFSESYNWGNVRFDGGGFVSAVLPSPAVEGLVYARTDVGGIYRWDATAARWIPLMDQFNQNDVGLFGTESFALDPTDPKKIYVLGGTGYFSDGRTAVLRSSDFGDHWDTSYVEFGAHGNGMGRQTGEKLAVDPNKPSIILCGSRSKGLYRSTDSGKSWSNLYKVALSEATGSSLNGVNGVSFVLFDANSKLADGSTGTIYLGLSQTADNLQVSNDGGKTWKTIEGGPSGQMPHRAKLLDGTLYITYADGPGPYNISKGSVQKYDIASGKWTDISPYDDNTKEDGSVVHEKNTSPFGGITIDPKDPKHIVVSTLGVYIGRHLFEDKTENYGDRIYVTTDGGATWTYGQNPGSDVPNMDPQDNKWIHGNAIHWAGSIEFDPFNSKKVWVTSGNGIFQTDDITAKVPVWKFQSRGIEETVPLDIVSIPGGPLVTAIGDYDGAAYTDINKSMPRHDPIIGTTQSLGYAPLTGSFVRTGVVTEYLQYESINHLVMYRSDDNAKTWTKLDTKLKGEKGLVVLSADGKVILHRPENGSTTYRSTDNGANWTAVDMEGGQTQNARIVADPVNPKVFYVMDMQGNLHRSDDAGASFSKYGATLNNQQNNEYYNGAGIIRTVPEKEGTLWVPLDQAQVWQPKGFTENGLAFTEDGGKSWTRCEGTSTAIAVGLGKKKEGADYETIFIWGAAKSGDPIGIYRSTDKCKTFERINDDAHQYGGPGNGNFVVGDMNNFGVVYMSTVGRGIVVGAPEGTQFVEIVDPEQPKTGIVRVNVEQKPTLQIQGRTLHAYAPTATKVALYNMSGKAILSESVGANAAVSLKKIPAGKYVAKILDASGKTLLQKNVSVK